MMDALAQIRRQRIKGNRLRKDRLFSDVTLICGDQRYACHRIILVSSSHFFDDVMQSSSTTTVPVTIELDDMTPDIMDVLLDFMYTGHVSTNLTDPDRMVRVLTASHQLQVWGAAAYLCSNWLHRMPTQHFLLFWEWSEKYGDEYVRSKVVKHIASNFQSISQGIEFLRLTYPRLCTVLSSKHCNPGVCHDYLLQSILKWIRHNIRGRECHLENLFSFIDLDKISTDYRQQLLDDKTWSRLPALLMRQGNASTDIKESHAPTLELPDKENDLHSTLKDDISESFLRSPKSSIASSLIGDKLISIDLSEKESSVKSSPKSTRSSSIPRVLKREVDISPTRTYNRVPSPTVPRKFPSPNHTNPTFLDAVHCHSGPALLVSGRGDVNQYLAFVYVPVYTAWSRSIEIPITPVENRGFLSYGSSIYLIGGEDSANRKLDSFYVYDLNLGILSQRTDMRVARCSAGIAQWNGMFFVAGGLSRFGQPMTHVEMYNLEVEAWKLMPPLRHKRFNPGVAIVRNHLYMIGGNTISCESYDLNNDVGWQEVVSLPDMFYDVGVHCASHDDHIFAFRAFRPDKLCCLDPGRNEWRVIRTFGTPPKDIIGMFNYKGDLYTLEQSGKLHVFDVEMVTWQPSISVPRACAKPLHLALLNLDHIK